jgi:NTP pyrophosphatase (non-canonical NTP hydrolase)
VFILQKGKVMNLSEFSKINRLRCESPHGFNHDLSGWSTSDWMTATLGELGEAANVVKKLNRVRDGIPGNDETEEELKAKLGRELADTFIYLDLLVQSVGLNLVDIVTETFDAKSAKIGSGYLARMID